MKKYIVYILECSDQSYYIGVTNDVFRREEEHNLGFDTKSYTYTRRPVKLVWYQEFTNPNEAISREKQLKGWGRKKKKALIAGDLDQLPLLSMNGLRQAQADNEEEQATNSGLRQAQADIKSDNNNHESLRQAQTDSTNTPVDKDAIIKNLPYQKPFLFVDSLLEINENHCMGTYTFKQGEYFYNGHFKNNPVTPGVILTECCAQIGLVCLGIYLLKEENMDSAHKLQLAFSSSEMEYLLPVYPNETVTVTSEKVYFRFQKLKAKVKMYNAKKELVCRGVLAGMIRYQDAK